MAAILASRSKFSWSFYHKKTPQKPVSNRPIYLLGCIRPCYFFFGLPRTGVHKLEEQSKALLSNRLQSVPTAQVT